MRLFVFLNHHFLYRKQHHYAGSLLLSALVLLSPEAFCQNVDCHFSLYRTDTRLADALQSKLLAGEKDATDAMLKMPDLVKQRRAVLLADVKKVTPDKQRDKVTAGKATHKNPDGSESPIGLEIDYLPAIGHEGGPAVLNLVASYHAQEDKVVKSRSFQTVAMAKSSIPVLLFRWQEEDANLMLVVSAAWDGPEALQTTASRTLYLDHAIYPDSDDTAANRNPVLRIVGPAKAGQGSTANGGFPMYYKKSQDEWSSEDVAWNIACEPMLADGDSVASIGIYAQHQQVAGKKARPSDGASRPELISRSAKGTHQIKIGPDHAVDMALSQESADASNSSAWKLTSKCLLYELK